MIDRQKAAQQAVSELDERIEGSLEASKVPQAKEYVDRAINILKRQSGGYDPESLARDLARSAVVEFAKARLAGQEPQNTQSYILAADRWSRVAAAEWHNQKNV